MKKWAFDPKNPVLVRFWGRMKNPIMNLLREKKVGIAHEKMEIWRQKRKYSMFIFKWDKRWENNSKTTIRRKNLKLTCESPWKTVFRIDWEMIWSDHRRLLRRLDISCGYLPPLPGPSPPESCARRPQRFLWVLLSPPFFFIGLASWHMTRRNIRGC